LGDDLVDGARGGSSFNEPGSNAFGTLTGGDFHDWQIGLQASIPIGYRSQLAGVRHAELQIARDRAMLQDLELEISHQLAEAVSDIDLNYALTQSNLSFRVATGDEVAAYKSRFDAGTITVDLLLDAQRRRADAETQYYRSIVDYNRAIMRVHYRKGSLLDYDGVCLAEGAWPGKAYFDAMREARKRNAAMYLDYGFSRPNVFSRGPIQQNCPDNCQPGAACDGGVGPAPDIMLPPAGNGPGETLPTPSTMPQQPPAGERSGAMPPRSSQAALIQSARPNAASAWSTSNEHQTNYAIAAAPATAAVRNGGQR